VEAHGGDFGALLRDRREAAGLSQQALADRSGLSIRAVRNIERGRTQWPYRDSLTRLADALGMHEAAQAEFLAAIPRRQLARPFLPVPRQLPASVSHFVGRLRELKAVTGLLDRATDEAAGAVVISAIGGTAGVGKTALAVHWAHLSADRFPDGQLYVNLAGFSPSGSPLAPGQAVRGFLEALGVRGEQVPQTLDDQAGLYRSLLAGRRMLVVLDNAADEEQVRPLLPGSPGCLALVTSRRQLAGLAVAEAAALITLDYLSDADAVRLLASRLSTDRIAAEPGAVGDLVKLCGGLPLALTVAAARAVARPRLPLATLTAELADTAGRLDALDAGGPRSLRAVFSWSIQQLSDDSARMFRLLGLHPGPDVSVPAAASLTGLAEADARRLLRELGRANLITEHVPGRYTLHDLLRAYAAEQAHAHYSQDERTAAVSRVLDHYVHTADRAARLLNPYREPVALASPRRGTAPEQPADEAQAVAWFDAEHQVLLAAVTCADSSGLDSHAWQLPWVMVSFLRIRSYWQEWAATQRTALAAATRLGDIAGQAVCGRLLANACTNLGDYDQARRHYASSLVLYQRLGRRLGEARVHMDLNFLAQLQGRYVDALGQAEQAMHLYQAIGDKAGEVEVLNNAGWCHGMLGDYQQARAFCLRALALCAETGNRWHEGYVWDSLGYAEHHLGNLAEAAACYQRGISLLQEAGDRFSEATALTHLGDNCQTTGELSQTQDAWRQALAILDDLQHPDADKIRAKLAIAHSTGRHQPSGDPTRPPSTGKQPDPGPRGSPESPRG
jgi:tetratricopeptide (TPR) repeat protein/transcriptional regulator with XRE-family HTH domain